MESRGRVRSRTATVPGEKHSGPHPALEGGIEVGREEHAGRQPPPVAVAHQTLDHPGREAVTGRLLTGDHAGLQRGERPQSDVGLHQPIVRLLATP